MAINKSVPFWPWALAATAITEAITSLSFHLWYFISQKWRNINLFVFYFAPPPPGPKPGISPRAPSPPPPHSLFAQRTSRFLFLFSAHPPTRPPPHTPTHPNHKWKRCSGWGRTVSPVRQTPILNNLFSHYSATIRKGLHNNWEHSVIVFVCPIPPYELQALNMWEY